MAGELVDQRAVLAVGHVGRPPMDGRHVGEPLREQRQSRAGPRGQIGDERFAVQLFGQFGKRRGEQGIIAAGDDEPVGEHAAVRRFHQPFVDQLAREQPFARSLGGGHAAFLDEGVDFLFVEVDVLGDLFDGEVGFLLRRAFAFGFIVHKGVGARHASPVVAWIRGQSGEAPSATSPEDKCLAPTAVFR